ncbi:putative ABC transport system permease protein [Geothermobacter ehrlichii]|uniref:Putative ABC transport system permease protein n=1 Tax=Geothermobacter ehrlichii TaxID=213224 RepID=A0A5D3WJN1_9BACT|nr:FtsX-like permease family protein [Geothermobacter ehrlichii]TYO98257.1 putative ABC transport system permease protein [Geothermobacter ehrlichii]
MRLETITLNNLRRRKGRAIFLLTGLLIGVATVVALLSLTGALADRARDELESFGANILITPRSDQLALSYGGISLGGVSLAGHEIDQESLAAIATIPNHRNIAAVAPKVLGAVEVAGGRALLMGVESDVEFGLKKWWQLTGERPIRADQLVLGSAAASRLGVAVGDELEVSGRIFRVSGVLRPTGSQDDQLLIVQLPVAQELLGKPGQVSLVEVAALCANCPIEDMVGQLGRALPDVEVRAVQQVVKTRMHAISQFRIFAWGVAAVVILVGALLVFVTMMGAVRERTREIGIFRAIGYRRSHVLRLVLVEAGVVSAFAGLFGYLAGVGVTLGALPLLGDGKAVWHFEPLLAVSALLAAVVVGLLAALQPALHASRLEPGEALRAL